MIYLDNGATTYPKAPNVGRKMREYIEKYGVNAGRGSYKLSEIVEEKILETRLLIKELFNIDNPSNIFFTSGATESINTAIQGALKKGDHVVTTAIEHNAVLRPIKFMEQMGVTNTIVPVNELGELNMVDLERAIRENTKLMVVNHVSNVLGTIQDIKDIGRLCKKHGIIFMVDAAQSAGKLNIDVKEENIDILAFPGHKGLLGPQGIGGLYISESVCDIVNPLKMGGTGSNSLELIQPSMVPDKFESGTLNIPGIIGLCEGIKFIKKETPERIDKKENEFIKYLVRELAKLSYVKIYGDIRARRAGALAINIDYMEPSEVGTALNKRNIAVRTGYHCAAMIHKCINTERQGVVRVTPGYFNTMKDMERFVEAIKDIYEEVFY
ncbi:cysteine desulfurase family protein [Hathewaya proteolytica DSM 3090]|uniref:cysteine desulfurase n=1 Tax=Hathewaya proteolytica DSM 3090 TaxID=1121331 RepID=A0A1M6PTM7_9CLOT|nr:aminotransferase class V-fold PLP-dependent enzyme [Hathewaya proteolytica]SHK11319.1 cysteine desulfurase family protein [Hathewaya proteolytica DSM 3090]